MRVIVGAIVVLVAAGILLWGTGALANIGKNSVDREACRDSVLLKARAKVLGQPLVGGNLNCKTNNLDIKNADEYEIKETLATEMYDCWYQFGQGQQDFLSDHDYWSGDNWCFVCSRIDYDADTQDNVPIVNGLFNYLKTEDIPLKNIKFFDYIYGQGYQMNASTSDSPIPTTEPTYVVFFADKRVTAGNVATGVGTILGGAAICAGGVVLAVKTAFIGTPAAVKACAWGVALVGGGFHSLAGTKSGYVQGLYVGPDSNVINACRQ